MTLQGRKALGATEIGQTWSFRGSKSRNKVSVGEPAEGSLQIHHVSLSETTLKCSPALWQRLRLLSLGWAVKLVFPCCSIVYWYSS
jgi:hypothetical protein